MHGNKNIYIFIDIVTVQNLENILQNLALSFNLIVNYTFCNLEASITKARKLFNKNTPISKYKGR